MFNASLVNDPFGDPAVYVAFSHKRQAVLFDLGDIHALPSRKILKLSHVFITHTHLDHFIGFDHLLRVCLGRDQHVRLYGPPGFIRNIESKLGAYSWNLVQNYTNDFVIHATEIDEQGEIHRCRFRCQCAFQPEEDTDAEACTKMQIGNSSDGFTILENDFFSVSCLFLDHKIPCLAYRVDERRRINIMKNKLEAMGLQVGPWLTELKAGILHNEPDSTPIVIWWREGGRRIESKALLLGFLRDNIVKIDPGEKIVYIADAVYCPENVDRIVNIAGNADHLFIESCFLEADSARAGDKYHLTAAQAGRMARQAGVKRITLFHFSPKYQGQGELLVQEAFAAFEGAG